MKNLIIYESKYGTTKESAYILSKVIGYSKVCTTSEFDKEDTSFDNYIILSPVYNDALYEKIKTFVTDNKDYLMKKDIYFIIVNLSGRPEFYLEEMKEILKDSLILMKNINGNLILNKLDKNDYESIIKFFTSINMPLEDSINFDINQAVEVALAIKDTIDNRKESSDKETIENIFTKFIKKNNTCVLSTCYNNNSRSTPMEYIYHNNMFYFISEGGVELANILRNNNVSIGIFDNYKNLKHVNGVQISGKAFIVEDSSDEYSEMLKIGKNNPNKIEKSDIILNVFKVSIEKIEILNKKI